MAGIEDVLERMREQGGERERRYGPRDPANPMWHASREFGYQGWRPDYVVNRDKGEPQADDAGEEEQMLRKALPMLSTSGSSGLPNTPPPSVLGQEADRIGADVLEMFKRIPPHVQVSELPPAGTVTAATAESLPEDPLMQLLPLLGSEALPLRGLPRG